MRKQQTNPIEIHSSKYLSNALQKPQGHEKLEKTEKQSQSGEDEEGILTACNVVSWIRSWNGKKDISGKLVKAEHSV